MVFIYKQETGEKNVVPDTEPNKSLIDFPKTIVYRNIAKLRLGYNKLKDYQFKLGICESNLCECGQIETVEHYLLHCELYFNERETLRTQSFNTTGTIELASELLLGCTKSDLTRHLLIAG